MKLIEDVKKPSKEEQRIATESFNILESVLKQLSSQNPVIEIEETKDRIRIPIHTLRLLSKILQVTAQGKPISIVPQEMEVTTQSAAELLGCSRPHLIKLLETGVIPYTLVGRHRRVKFEDLQKYKKALKISQKKLLIELMQQDQDYNMYDS
jgi:excisionase family DNA binding protein